MAIHGKTYMQEYWAWIRMKSRCYNPKESLYARYGGRGIKVCDRWLGKGGFENFYEDLGRMPSSHHQLNRINNNGNYELNNCAWATRKEQANNTSRNVFLTYKGKTQTAAQWGEELGVSGKVLAARKRKWGNDEKVLTVPYRPMGPKRELEYMGKKQGLKEWAQELGVTRRALQSRLDDLGWSVEKTVTTPRVK